MSKSSPLARVCAKVHTSEKFWVPDRSPPMQKLQMQFSLPKDLQVKPLKPFLKVQSQVITGIVKTHDSSASGETQMYHQILLFFATIF